MRIFHTSDWHLGQLFYQHSRDEEHRQFLAWLLTQIDQQQPDALIIAGDIFDTVNPPLQAQRLLYDFLADAHQRQPQLHIVMIAGNHDSGGRIELPAPLLQRMNTHVIGRIRWQGTRLDTAPLLLPIRRDDRILGWCLALPFLRIAESSASGQGLDSTQAQVQIYQQLIADAEQQRQPEQPLVLISHAHVQGATTSPDSERHIIGHLEGLCADVFSANVDYVALGHLHKPQQVGGQARIRYSGSPIPLSFSEIHYPHQVLCVDLVAGQQPQIQTLKVPRSVQMHKIPAQGQANLHEVLACLRGHTWPSVADANQRAWLEVNVWLDGPAPPDLRQQIEALLPADRVRLLRLRPQQQQQTDRAQLPRYLQAPEPLPAPQQLFERIWQQKFGHDDTQVFQDFALLLAQLETEDHA